LIKLFKRSEQTDDELIKCYRQSLNKEYVGRLFERYASFVFAICMKYIKDKELSRDITMVVFEKIIDLLLRFEVKYFKSWLYQVSKNESLMYIRNNKKTVVNSDIIEKNQKLFMENESNLNLDEKQDEEIKLDKLPEAMNSLSEKQKICIEMFYLKEQSYIEVSKNTGFTLNEVKSYIQNGKRNLKIYLTSVNV